MPISPRPVVVAIDAGSCEASLRYAATEALRARCGLHVLHAIPLGSVHRLLEPADLENVARVAEATLIAAVARAEHLIDDRVPVTSELFHGPVVQGVVEVSQEARTVVLQHRRPSVRQGMEGRSVASAVAARTSVPVVSVPSDWTDPAGGVVAVGVDVPEHSQALLREAFEAARVRGSSVRVIHTWWSPPWSPPGSELGPEMGPEMGHSRVASDQRNARARQEISSLLSFVEGDSEFFDVPVEVDVRHGHPADVLVEASRGAELLVVGRHDAWIPLGSHLGPVAHAVLRDAECPVLLVAPIGPHQMAVRHLTATGARSG